MPEHHPRLTLVIPHLFRAARELAPFPRLPALERMVARGVHLSVPEETVEHRCAERFGLTTQGDLPLGALGRIGDGAAPDDHWWFCAAPAHFYAARDRLRLASVEEVDATEAAALVSLFNGHFAADGWLLESASPSRWYLRAPGPQALRTRTLDEAITADLLGAFPEGPDALRCHRFLNEAQMLFHGSAINPSREERGLPAINGLWFWGGGRAPALEHRFDQVWSDLPVVRGLGRVSGAEVQPMAGRLPRVTGDAFAVLESITAGEWQGTEHEWFAPVEQALRHGMLGSVELLFDRRVVTVTRRDLRRWWHLRRTLDRYA